jgi:hypothetical protein
MWASSPQTALSGSTATTIQGITPTASGCIFTYSGGSTHYRVYALGGAAGAWVALGASPVTLTGLAANSEFTLDISDDASTVADTADFGTLNVGTGGGEIDTTQSPVPVLTLPTATDITATSFRPRVSYQY